MNLFSEDAVSDCQKNIFQNYATKRMVKKMYHGFHKTLSIHININ